jgi:hypothetical protein
MFCFFIYLESAVSDNRFTVKIPRKTSTLKKNVVMEDESSMLSNYRQMELRIFRDLMQLFRQIIRNENVGLNLMANRLK